MSNGIPNEIVAQIQSEVNVVDIVNQYVQLKKRGKNYFGFCPFHDERTPSFSVSEDKQLFYCFSCGRGGSVFSFISEVEGLSFTESVAKVVEMADLPFEISSQSSGERQEITKHHNLYLAHQEAEGLYKHVLLHTRGGETALNYLLDRGYSQETIETFALGFSPQNRTTLVSVLKPLNLTEEELNSTGLFVQNEETFEFIDRFYQRIMIPLRDANGKVVGFSGRILPAIEDSLVDQHQAKYLNSPESPLFNKRNFLFNFDLARPEIRRQSKVILFEGYMDVIAAYQAGVTNGVASMGTSLTQEQIRILNRASDQIVIAYDGDRAGQEATKRAIEIIQEYSTMSIAILPLEDGMDPDEFIKKFGATAFKERIEHQVETVFQFKKRFLRGQYRLEIEKERVEYVEQLIQEIAQIKSIVEQDIVIGELTKEFAVSNETIRMQIGQYLAKHKSKPKQVDLVNRIEPKESFINKGQSLLEPSQKHLLYRLIHSPQAWTYLFAAQEDFYFPEEDYQQIYFLLQHFRNQQGVDFQYHDFLNQLTDQTSIQIVTSLEWLDISEECSKREIEDLVFFLSVKVQLKEKDRLLTQNIKLAQERGDFPLMQQLMIEKIGVQRQLKQRIGSNS
ncbi:DNA primase [Granulicatella seriolae]|uniref:DNA primase n=1 Tax=Granulicatella seriolae TaxID=2967226 RepID=A0ABT1WP82_9LACT|nr:DNA primase [Granulicatella seriolae]